MKKYKPLKDFFLENDFVWDESCYLLHSISVDQKDDMYLYHERGNLVAKDHPVITKCQGLVINQDSKVMNYPFDKFFDSSEKEKSHIDWLMSRTEEMLDGVMICVFWSGSGWQMSSKNSFFENSTQDLDYLGIFMKNFRNFDRLRKNNCYMFVVVSSKKRIVTRYNEDRIYLVGARDINNLKEFSNKTLDNMASFLRVSRPFVFFARNGEDCYNIIEKHRSDFKGLIVKDYKNRRVKFLNLDYFRLKHLINSDLNDSYCEQILFEHVIRNKELSPACLFEFDKIVKKLKEINFEWGKTLTFLELEFEKVKNLDRENFLKNVYHLPYRDYLRSLYEKKDFKFDNLEWEKVKNWRK